ncbi:unnamed protein product [Sphagnum jensenii]|uniref:Uncharacterized protein n=2 Tax=Sphagnum jensenii TaxID=128206 RepID=A0ABP1AX08_9BRYO
MLPPQYFRLSRSTASGNISAMPKSFKELKKHLVKYYHCVSVIYILLCLSAYSMVIGRSSSSISDLAAHSTAISPSEVRGFHLDQSGLQNVH